MHLVMKRAIAAGFVGLSLLGVDSLFSQAQAAQQFTCTGQMDNGWAYTANFVNGRFTQIRWEQTGQPPQTTDLTFDTINALGQPIYRGSFLAAVTVTLVDLSGGNVQGGSEISVGVEEWGWSRGTCATPDSGSVNDSTNSVAAVRRNLLGVDQGYAEEWLRQNNFFFANTIEHSEERVVYRWNRNTEPFSIHVIVESGFVTDVQP